MAECTDGSVVHRTACILSYAGNGKDIVINYVLLVLNVGACLRLAWSATRLEQQLALGALVFTILYQIVLCLILGCSGISIIWCACAGWILYPAKARKASKFEQIALVSDAAAIFYYLIVSEAITTVAHFGAILMGVLLSWGANSLGGRTYSSVDTDSATADSAAAQESLVDTVQ